MVWVLRPNGLSTGLVEVYQNAAVLDIEEFSIRTVSVNPNLTTNNININFKQDGEYSFSMYDITGKELHRQEELNKKIALIYRNMLQGFTFKDKRNKYKYH